MARDETAERALFDRHVERLHRIVFRITGDEALTEEFVQDAFVRAFQGLSTFRFEASFPTWLTRIAIRVALNGLEREGRRGEVELPVDLADPRGADTGAPFLAERVRQALDSLRSTDRAIIGMFVEGYTHEEIASALGITPGASKTRLSRARAQLRDQLEEIAEGLQA
jgi:RNA polymerase sigma-70 factor (ECF subfamily)